MREDRLLRLAVLLEEDAINPNGIKFDLETWGNDARFDNNNAVPGRYAQFYTPDMKVIPVDCRTAACGMGLAAISGIFKVEGLTWVIRNDWLIPTFNGEDGFDAALAFFELPDQDTVNYLFSSERYPHNRRKGKEAELVVAKRIRDLVTMRNLKEGQDY